MSELSKAVGLWIMNNLSWAIIVLLVVLSGLFKLTKIEINPLGWVLKTIGNAMTKDVRKDLAELKLDTDTKLAELRNDLDKIEESNDLQTIRQIKTHVLNFANSCLNRTKHTKQDFDNIIRENEEYERLVAKYGLKNDVYAEDFSFIMKVYHKCQDNGSFLKESDAEG